MSPLSFTAGQVLQLADAFEARATRAAVVVGGGKARCVTAETLRDCASQVRRFASMPAPERTDAITGFLRTRQLDVEGTALALELMAPQLPPRHCQVARDAAVVIRRFLDLQGPGNQ